MAGIGGGIGLQAIGWRGDIVDKAREWIGAHYLWGTAGNSLEPGPAGLPSLRGKADGLTDAKRRTAFALDIPTQPPKARAKSAASSFGYQAAYCTTGGQHVCCGRFKSTPLGSVATYFSNPARNAKLLACYLEYKASNKPLMIYAIEWAQKNYGRMSPDNPGPQIWFDTLSPRIGYATVDAKATVHDQLIWGEPCQGIRHFDCVGLVNAAYSQALGWGGITYDIWAWPQQAATQYMPPGTPVLPGDIIFKYSGTAAQAQASARPSPPPPRGKPPSKAAVDALDAEHRKWHHIALCVGDNAGSVIQGEEGPVGVTIRPNLITAQGVFLDTGFNYRARVPDHVLAQWRQQGSFKGS